MSSICSKLTQKQTDHLVLGFIRINAAELGLFLPRDLSSICHKFYHDIIYWTLKDNELQAFHDCRCNRKIKLDSEPKFSINGIPFELHLYPKLQIRWTEEQTGAGVICTRLSASCKNSLPDNIKFGALYIVLFCYEMNYEFRHLLRIAPDRSNTRGVYPYGLKYADIKNQKLDEITFGCYIEVISLEYKPSSASTMGVIQCNYCHQYYKSSDFGSSEDRCLVCMGGDIPKELQVQVPVPAPAPFIRDIRIDSKSQYEWILNQDQLELFINAAVDFSIYSPNFNHDTFCIVTAPNGLTMTQDTTGYVLQKIKLLKLPYGVMGIFCDYKLELKMIDMNGEERVFIRSEERKFEYSNTGKNEKDIHLTLDLFENAVEIKFTSTVNVLQVFDKEDQLIEKKHWNKYGIF